MGPQMAVAKSLLNECTFLSIETVFYCIKTSEIQNITCLLTDLD